MFERLHDVLEQYGAVGAAPAPNGGIRAVVPDPIVNGPLGRTLVPTVDEVRCPGPPPNPAGA